MQKSDCIISVEHVSKFFGDKAVLNDVNLFVRKGEFVTILGPSGCGKTTLLRLIAGFQTASEGGRSPLQGRRLHKHRHTKGRSIRCFRNMHCSRT